MQEAGVEAAGLAGVGRRGCGSWQDGGGDGAGELVQVAGLRDVLEGVPIGSLNRKRHSRGLDGVVGQRSGLDWSLRWR